MNIELSKTHKANLSSMVGQGLITDKDAPGKKIPCSLGCEQNATAEGHDYTQVFAVIKHPNHGHIAVTQQEFGALGLPEYTYDIDCGTIMFRLAKPLTLKMAINEYPTFRAAIKRLLLKALQTENSEYAADAAEAGTLRYGSDHYINTIARCDDAYTEAKELQSEIDRAAATRGMTWLLGDETDIHSDNIHQIIRVAHEMFYDEDDIRDESIRESWINRLNCASMLFIVQ